MDVPHGRRLARHSGELQEPCGIGRGEIRREDHAFEGAWVFRDVHGYLAFDREGELLVPFRTWRNTKTEEAAADLTSRFGFNIPQRWSIAHLHQAILNNEPHVKDIAFITTLAGYVHWKLTGEKVLGIGDASGMFPIDSEHNVYDSGMMDTFDILHKEHNLPWRLRDILPQIRLAGEDAGELTDAGALLLDPTGTLNAGAPLCRPEGDAGTGMTATNSVRCAHRQYLCRHVCFCDDRTRKGTF